MKSNKTFNFISKFKYLMLIPIVLALVSILIGAIWGLNLDYDFQKVSNFTVKFNTTVTECEYVNLTDSLKEIIKENDFDKFRIARIGEGAQNGLIVKVPNNDAELNDRLEELRIVIEENLLVNAEDIDSNVVVSTSELSTSMPKNVTNILLFTLLALGCVVLFVIAYKWIRYNLMAGLSLATSIALEIAMLFAGMVAFRIPFNVSFMVPFVVMILTTIINATVINNYIKLTLNNETYNKFTNVDRVLEATKKNYKGIAIYMTMLSVITLAVMFFGGASLIFLGLAIVLGLIISAFVSLFINNSLWSFWYNKERDRVLTRRIEAEKRREDIKSGKEKDDKLVI